MNNKINESKITQALESYPQADLPPNFLSNVMTKVDLTPQEAKTRQKLKIQIGFLPASISVFAIVFTSAVVWVYNLVIDQINPLMIAYYHNLFQYWKMRLHLYQVPAPGTYITLIAIAAAIYWLAYLFTDPKQINA